MKSALFVFAIVSAVLVGALIAEAMMMACSHPLMSQKQRVEYKCR